MHDGHRVAVVVPAFNEADKIAHTLTSIPASVDHVIVVDDGSRDDTAAIAAAVARPGVAIVRHARNLGVGAAIATGYAHARRLDVDVAVVMAGDAQMHPDDLVPLLDAVLKDGADYAKGNRFLWQGPGRAREVMPRLRLLGNVVLSWCTRIATGNYRVFDSQCGYTAASARALDVLAARPLFARYGYPNAILLRLAQSGLVVADVPVRPVYGPGWRSGIRLHKVILPLALLLLRGYCARMVSLVWGWGSAWLRTSARAISSLSERTPGRAGTR